MKTKEKMYKVYYSMGSHEDYREIDIFITSDKETAEKYVKKFNSILKKWKDYYDKYTDEFTNSRVSYSWLDNEIPNKYYFRWDTLQETNECKFKEIEIR